MALVASIRDEEEYRRDLAIIAESIRFTDGLRERWEEVADIGRVFSSGASNLSARVAGSLELVVNILGSSVYRWTVSVLEISYIRG